VGEPPAAAALGVLDHQPGRQRRLDQREDALGRQAGDGGERVDAEAVRSQRGDRQHLGGFTG
jgi:hypothetical protein